MESGKVRQGKKPSQFNMYIGKQVRVRVTGSIPLGITGSQFGTYLRRSRKLGYLSVVPNYYGQRAVSGVSPQYFQLALPELSMLLGPKIPPLHTTAEQNLELEAIAVYRNEEWHGNNGRSIASI